MTYKPWPQKKDTNGLAFLVTNCDNEKPENPLGKDWVPRDFLAGTIHDHDKWMTALTKLNFDVRWERNLDRNLMINFLKTVSSIDLNPGCEYAIFVFCGHGGEGVIYAQDGEGLRLKDDVFPPFFQGNMSGLKKLFFIDACRVSSNNSPTLTQALFGPGEYFALCPVPYGSKAVDFSGGSPFSEAVTRYIVEDISLAEVVQKVGKSLRERAQKDKVQNELVTEISTLQTSPRLSAKGSSTLGMQGESTTGTHVTVAGIKRSRGHSSHHQNDDSSPKRKPPSGDSEEPAPAPPPVPPIVTPCPNPTVESYTHVKAKDVINSLDWCDLSEDIKDMLKRSRVNTMEKQYKLIDPACNLSIVAALDKGNLDDAAATLIKYFAKTHDGDALLKFCEFLRKEAKAVNSARLKALADKIERAVKTFR